MEYYLCNPTSKLQENVIYSESEINEKAINILEYLKHILLPHFYGHIKELKNLFQNKDVYELDDYIKCINMIKIYIQTEIFTNFAKYVIEFVDYLKDDREKLYVDLVVIFTKVRPLKFLIEQNNPDVISISEIIKNKIPICFIMNELPENETLMTHEINILLNRYNFYRQTRVNVYHS